MPSGVLTSNFDSLLSVGTSSRRVPDSSSRLVADFDDSGARELMFLWASTHPSRRSWERGLRKLGEEIGSRHSDSNRGPTVYKTVALPLSYAGAGGKVSQMGPVSKRMIFENAVAGPCKPYAKRFLANFSQGLRARRRGGRLSLGQSGEVLLRLYCEALSAGGAGCR